MTNPASDRDRNFDVLVVDDEEDVLRAHQKILEQAGFKVTCADDGLKAFDEIQKHIFRAIVCDVRMPYLGGKSLFEQLEEAYPTAAARVVFVSGLLSDDETKTFLEQSGQPFLWKPAEIEEFVEVVRGVVEQPMYDRGK